MIEARVIALGQRVAGDDGAGLAVLDELRRRIIPTGIELVEARDASALIPLLETSASVVIVDAAVGMRPGQVIEIPVGALAVHSACEIHAVSSHGIGIAAAVALVRQLSPDRISPSIRIVLLTIARPDRFRTGLSPPVAAVIVAAADHVLARARDNGAVMSEVPDFHAQSESATESTP